MNRKSKSRRSRQAAFTLLELMIVISIMAILMSIAIPNYQRSIVHARETVLLNDLTAMRTAIDQYTLDKQKAPQSLDDLVTAGYLKSIPKDPITNSTECWVTVNEDSMMAVDQTQPGIIDVHSCNDNSSSAGTAYSTW